MKGKGMAWTLLSGARFLSFFLVVVAPGIAYGESTLELFFPLPLSVEAEESLADKVSVLSGVYLKARVIEVRESFREIADNMDDVKSPRRSLVKMFRALLSADLHGFRAQVDGEKKDELYTFSIEHWCPTFGVNDLGDLMLNQELEVGGGLTVLLVNGPPSSNQELFAFTMVRRKNADDYVYAPNYFGHEVMQAFAGYVTGVNKGWARSLKPRTEVPGALEITLKDPFEIGSDDPVTLLVKARGTYIPVLVDEDHRSTPRCEHRVPSGVLMFYKAAMNALRVRDVEAYCNRISEQSRARVRKQLLKDEEHGILEQRLSDKISGWTSDVRIGGVISEGPLTILIRSDFPGAGLPTTDLVWRKSDDSYRLVNVNARGGTRRLFDWKPFRTKLDVALAHDCMERKRGSP